MLGRCYVSVVVGTFPFVSCIALNFEGNRSFQATAARQPALPPAGGVPQNSAGFHNAEEIGAWIALDAPQCAASPQRHVRGFWSQLRCRSNLLRPVYATAHCVFLVL
ncbi:hypothetical protein HYPSUDRAFT_41131 [Hypholoma sublateritium FD-334 SS-4]|uniref:Uncharacterized protein n=1 Tax=Hypholoma sublateritium (strain FD-334 SS-4) TaxID=945553 RepID=A0A0D2MF93_HYPSF|nr:hypothetical protein HYPSUDRAFT_41131 [Hypholoma sublateritium FD-334 SS-4]